MCFAEPAVGPHEPPTDDPCPSAPFTLRGNDELHIPIDFLANSFF